MVETKGGGYAESLPVNAIRNLTIVVLLAAAACGCTEADRQRWDSMWGRPSDLVDPTSEYVPLETMAADLKLRVLSASAYSAMLRDASGNLVTLVVDPGGAVLVNGRPLTYRGQISPHEKGDSLLLPRGLDEDLARALRTTSRPRRALVAPEAPSRLSPPIKLQYSGPRLGPVLIDAGHGGKDPGAVGGYGVAGQHRQVREKDVVLAVALDLASVLRAQNVEVILTRSDDTFIPLADRVAIANRSGARLMLSLHADAAANSSASGFTVYLGRSPSSASITAASAIAGEMASLNLASRGIRRHPKTIRVINEPRIPSVLVEMGFVSNSTDASDLDRADHRRRLASAMAIGIIEYLSPPLWTARR
ncbi:MAG: N-acetylmuramoyl-L-alanine amidase [Planctomycetaceae bacterium]|nr:N-acetylmuramoyl-L-alanine amidase [Planctomycetaceae bacterium]